MQARNFKVWKNEKINSIFQALRIAYSILLAPQGLSPGDVSRFLLKYPDIQTSIYTNLIFQLLNLATISRQLQILLVPQVSPHVTIILTTPLTRSSLLATHLSNQCYTACFRQEQGNCGICFVAANSIAISNMQQTSFGLRYHNIASVWFLRPPILIFFLLNISA